jgi:hypothetical protein
MNSARVRLGIRRACLAVAAQLRRRAVTTAGAVVIGGGSSVLACPMCFGAEETSMVDGTKLGILVMLAITLAVQGGFVGFFLYLRKRAKRIAEIELETEWSELQRASRTLVAPKSDATSQNSVRHVNLRGWGSAGPQAR